MALYRVTFSAGGALFAAVRNSTARLSRFSEHLSAYLPLHKQHRIIHRSPWLIAVTLAIAGATLSECAHNQQDTSALSTGDHHSQEAAEEAVMEAVSTARRRHALAVEQQAERELRKAELILLLAQFQIVQELEAGAQMKREKRVAELSELRARTSAITQLLEEHAAVQDQIVRTHLICDAMNSLRDANEDCGSLGPHFKPLLSIAGDDEVIRAAIDVLPPIVMEHGILTRNELKLSFDAVERLARAALMEEKIAHVQYIPKTLVKGITRLALALYRPDTHIDISKSDDQNDHGRLDRAWAAIAVQNSLEKSIEALNRVESEAVRQTLRAWLFHAQGRLLFEQVFDVVSNRAQLLMLRETTA